MKQIPLTRGLFALVDDEDYDSLSKYKWHAAQAKNVFYARRNLPRDGNKRTFVLMHREVLCLMHGQMCDHSDGNGLNNQRSNLRIASYSQNGANAKSRGMSKYRGVHFNTRSNKWCAIVRKDRKTKYVGSFNTEIEAAEAYNKAAKELHGEFSFINVIQKPNT